MVQEDAERESKNQDILVILEEINENIILLQRIQFYALACMQEQAQSSFLQSEAILWNNELENEFSDFARRSLQKIRDDRRGGR
ncbi:MAG: hypothetical protein Q4E64_03910 [Phascolarctobacterium sp.]|nr:hypothetical protein [Phascolarctobacterium sp.]